MFRTNTCKELTEKNIGEEIALAGWVYRRRDHGDLIFVDLRDFYGITQISFDPADFPEAHKLAHSLRTEFVISVKGKVRKRPDGQENSRLFTGNIEILVSELSILNKSKTPPFEIDNDNIKNEELRLKYKYLDLRREKLRKNLVFRSKTTKFFRDFFDEESFLDVETPVLIKGTPEGSREYLVPSRIYPGNFFVLPQSPQQLKQLLMVAGVDKYFQIAKCFRDEDLRADRQPEFSQIDVEMCFTEQEEVINLSEKLFLKYSEKFGEGKKVQNNPFQRMTWLEAMEKYGSDKPDLRFGLELKDVSEIVKNCGFKVFSGPSNDKNGCVKAICVPGGDKFSRKEIDELTKFAQDNGAKGLAYIQVREEGLTGPVAKFLTKEELEAIKKGLDAKVGDIIFFGADAFLTVCNALGAVRDKIGDILGLKDEKVLAFAWILDFPLFEKNEKGQIVSAHHPFTMPNLEDFEKYKNTGNREDLLKIRSKAYDLVLNGYELGGGSIRIHQKDLQKEVFSLMEIGEKEQEMKFGHILEAFEYGTPPHGGIAFGLERILMTFLGEESIREVMAFPKDQKSKDLMLGAPSFMPNEQIEELGLEIVKDLEI